MLEWHLGIKSLPWVSLCCAEAGGEAKASLHVRQSHYLNNLRPPLHSIFPFPVRIQSLRLKLNLGSTGARSQN